MADFSDTRSRYLQEARKRREKAKKLRADGLSFAEIGKRLGVTRQRAHAMIEQQ